ncbi:MAG: polyprenyl synthetase family protein [Acidimicrobiia bacterium]|nr:polyprenyl synthetase family protein [Acidimicrobiia bacterium]
MAAPPSLLCTSPPVEARLRSLLEEERDRWAAVDPDLVEPLDTLGELLLAGGKRLRPAFCHWAHVGAGGDPDDARVVDAGAALELLHAFALVHDDVMDGSDLRRGVDAAHRAHARRHDREGWAGESRRFGEGVAILVGDLSFVYADALLRGAPLEARSVFDELRLELNMGQYLDVLGTARGAVQLETARRIASYKSGKYTIERPLHLGAALAGRLPELVGPLSAYGLPLGEAFQLRDDVLGAFGETVDTGKPVGDDLREGKPTPLLALARRAATAEQLEVLDRVGDPSLDAVSVAELQQVYVATGALADVEQRIEALTDEALAVAKELPVTAEAQVALTELATYVAERTS